jgi:hypothetical protein
MMKCRCESGDKADTSARSDIGLGLNHSIYLPIELFGLSELLLSVGRQALDKEPKI